MTNNHYQGMGPLFDKPTLANKTFLTEVVDICARKHKGNEQSTQTFREAIRHRITEQQDRVLKCMRRYPEGLTCDELSVILGVTPNQISGRLTELKRDGKIYKSGTRKTRSGCSAAILKSF